MIHTIGVGDPTSAGEELLNEEALRKVADGTGGRYFFAAERNDLSEIYEELDQISEREVQTSSNQPKEQLFQYPLALVLVLTLLHFGITSIGNVNEKTLVPPGLQADSEREAA